MLAPQPNSENKAQVEQVEPITYLGKGVYDAKGSDRQRFG